MSNPFEGSTRQLRGLIVQALRRGPQTARSLAGHLGQPSARVQELAAALIADGIITAAPGGWLHLSER